MKKSIYLTLSTMCLVITITACGGGGSSGAGSDPYEPPNPESGNVVPVVVKLPHGSASILNVPYVSVTICTPGTSTCQTIDDIILDTGSMGLRIFADKITSNIQLGATGLGECALFGSGYDWGSLKIADVKMAGEVASSVPIQIINDPAVPIPNDCSNMGNYNDLGGANGIIGVNGIPLDVDGPYFDCSNPSTCSYTSRVNYNQKVLSPVYKFAEDNNGVIVSLPNVPSGGAKDLVGNMTFGIGTQINNQLSPTAHVFYGDIYGQDAEFITSYNNIEHSSIFDTGSTELFLNAQDPNLPFCSGAYSEFYCPSSTYQFNTTMASYDGSNPMNYAFDIINFYQYITQYPSSAAVPNSAASGDDNWIIWGLPFFYGNNVYVGFARAISTSTFIKPYFAFAVQ